ncbi:MAG: acyltransferase [Novosphingobium sp.]
MAQDNGNRLVLLDGLRGVAALMVVLFHANLDGSAPAFSRGYLLVDLFFLLSGFVLTLAFRQKFSEGMGTSEFLRLRWSRFRPMVITGALLGLAANIEVYHPLMLVGVTVAACLMIPQGLGEPMYQTNAAQWSLLDELFANALHAGLLHKLGWRQLAVIALSCGTGFAICTCHFGHANLGAAAATLIPGLLRTGWSYILGILLARAWMAGFRPPRTDWRMTLLAPGLLVLAVPLIGLPVWAGDLGVVLVAFPALFWLALGSGPSPGASHRLAFLGAISFPLYALHLPVLAIWDSYLLPGHGRASGVPLVLFVAIVAMLFAGYIGRRRACHSARLQQDFLQRT